MAPRLPLRALTEEAPQDGAVFVPDALWGAGCEEREDWTCTAQWEAQKQARVASMCIPTAEIPPSVFMMFQKPKTTDTAAMPSGNQRTNGGSSSAPGSNHTQPSACVDSVLSEFEEMVHVAQHDLQVLDMLGDAAKRGLGHISDMIRAAQDPSRVFVRRLSNAGVHYAAMRSAVLLNYLRSLVSGTPNTKHGAEQLSLYFQLLWYAGSEQHDRASEFEGTTDAQATQDVDSLLDSLKALAADAFVKV